MRRGSPFTFPREAKKKRGIVPITALRLQQGGDRPHIGSLPHGNIAEKAIVTGPPEFPTRKRRFELEETATHSPIDYLCAKPQFMCRENDVVLMQGNVRSYGRLLCGETKKMVPTKGRYAVRVRAGADPGTTGGPVVMRVTRGKELILEREVNAPADEPQVYETVLPLEARGGNELHVELVNETTDERRGIQFPRPSESRNRGYRSASQVGVGLD